MYALLLSVALAQAFAPGPPGKASGGKVLATYPLSTTGPLITEDANTVAHVYWNGTALVDTKGNSWTENGTVPQVTANPFTTTRYGAGPFSVANYYDLGAGADVLDFAGDFTVCIVYSGHSGSAAQLFLLSNGNYGASGAGYMIGTFSDQRFQINFDAAGSVDKQARTANAATVGPNVACAGRAGTTAYAKLNLGTTASTAGVTIETGSAYPARIGYGNYSWSAYVGTLYEVYATSTAFSEATVTAIQQKVLGHFDGSSALAVTRATTATYAPLSTSPQTLYTVPAGVARFSDLGMLVEPARTNSLRRSNTISTANAFDGADWIAWPAEAVVDVTTTTEAAPGGGTWHTITNEAGATDNTGQAYQTASAGTSSEHWVASTWMKKPVGEDTTAASLHIGCGAGAPRAGAANCLCYRSDGGACTASTVAVNYCQALVSDLGTTPIRLTVGVRCDAALTTPIVALVPGSYGVSIGITDFSGVQAESAGADPYSTSLIVTTTTAAARNADSISATVVAMPASKWCVASTFQLLPPRTLNQGRGSIWGWGGGANSVNLDSSWNVTGSFGVNIFDAASNYKSYSASDTAANAQHRAITCINSANRSLTLDGTPKTLVAGAGGGTGITAGGGTTFYFGRESAGGYIGAWLKGLKICKATKEKECK